MANKRDYYEVLGIDKNATDEDIKRAYRKKARTESREAVRWQAEADRHKSRAEQLAGSGPPQLPAK